MPTGSIPLSLIQSSSIETLLQPLNERRRVLKLWKHMSDKRIFTLRSMIYLMLVRTQDQPDVYVWPRLIAKELRSDPKHSIVDAPIVREMNKMQEDGILTKRKETKDELTARRKKGETGRPRMLYKISPDERKWLGQFIGEFSKGKLPQIVGSNPTRPAYTY